MGLHHEGVDRRARNDPRPADLSGGNLAGLEQDPHLVPVDPGVLTRLEEGKINGRSVHPIARILLVAAARFLSRRISFRSFLFFAQSVLFVVVSFSFFS